MNDFDRIVLATLRDEPPDWDELDESQIIQHARTLTQDSTLTAIRRGQVIRRFGLLKDDGFKKIGICRRLAEGSVQAVVSPRMHREDWSRPCRWSACYPLIAFDRRQIRYHDVELSDYRYTVVPRDFEEIIRPRFNGFMLIDYDTSRDKVNEAIAAAKKWRLGTVEKEESVDTILPADFLNQIVCGDCLKVIEFLRNGSIHLVVTSPPYGQQRRGHYQGVEEAKFAEWLCALLKAIRPKLARGGSVMIIIRAPERGGQVLPFVLDARQAVRQMGWFEPQQLMWVKASKEAMLKALKKDKVPSAKGVPLGSLNRLTHGFEEILWFAPEEPLIDLVTGGNPTKRRGLQGSNPHGLHHSPSDGHLESGIARKMDVFFADASKVDKNVNHPAKSPPALIEQLIETFSFAGQTILDPCVGSGTVALCARKMGRNFIGIDIEKKFVDLANDRLKNDRRYR